MKKYIIASTILLSFMTIILLLQSQEQVVSAVQSDNLEIQDEEIIVGFKYDLDQLIVFEPKFETIAISVNESPSDSLEFPNFSDYQILTVAAAYTHEYKSENAFSHKNIEGDHVVGGSFYEGNKCDENTGAFVYANRHWRFVYDDYQSSIKAAPAFDDACAFAQTMLVYEHKVLPLPDKFENSNKKALRRALCDYQNRLVVMESKSAVTYKEFAQSLLEAGVYAALYLDMGDMSYSLWRDKVDGDEQILHPKHDNLKFATNFLHFYWVD